MIKIDIIFRSKYVSHRREKMICISGTLALIVPKSVLADRGLSSGSRYEILVG